MLWLYKLVSDPEWAEILTIMFFGMVCLSYLSFVWGNAKKTNKRLSTFQWGQIYFLAIMVFLSTILIFGKFIVPENSDKLLGMLHVDDLLRKATIQFQKLLLPIIRSLM